MFTNASMNFIRNASLEGCKQCSLSSGDFEHELCSDIPLKVRLKVRLKVELYRILIAIRVCLSLHY